MVQTKKYTELLECKLNDEEVSTAGRELARMTSRLRFLEDNKKRVVSQITADMESVKADIRVKENYITTGAEFRSVECTQILDAPEKGKKTIIRIDTGEEVRVTFMTDEDRQFSLDLQSAAEKEEAERREAADSLRRAPMAQLEAMPEQVDGEGFTVTQPAAEPGQPEVLDAPRRQRKDHK